MIDKMKEFVKNKNNLVVVVLAGVLLMVIALPVNTGSKNKGNTVSGIAGTGNEEENNTSYLNEQVSGYTEEEELTAYAEAMEQKVEELLCRMEGAGRVKVIITWECSVERVVEKDEPVNRSNTMEEDSEGGTRTVNTVDAGESTVYSSSGNESEPYVVKTINPKVEGVVVLAEGAGSGNVSKNISDAIQVLFGIEAHRIKVIKMESAE